MRGLIIRAIVTTPVVTPHAPGRVNLDALLAAAAIMGREHEMPSLYHEVRSIDIPGLACLWRDAHGRPLWAASCLAPETELMHGKEYAHRRYPAHRADFSRKPSANTSAGQFKEYRKPLRTVVADRWCALAIGDAEGIRAMLADVGSIGARRGAGYGRIQAWEVAESEDVTADRILSLRPAPVAYLAESCRPLERPVSPLCGWTPPYHHAPWFAPCVEPETCS